MKRWWRGEEWDEEIFFLVRKCMKANMVLYEISEMKRWRVRWRDEKIFFWGPNMYQAKSGVKYFSFLNLVLSEISEMKRWKKKLLEWDEEMEKNFFWVRTYVKSNLVLSEISEMKSEMKRWTDEKIFFGSEHVSSQIWCYLKLVRWRDEEWDEEMNRWRNFFLGPNMYQAKSGVIWN